MTKTNRTRLCPEEDCYREVLAPYVYCDAHSDNASTPIPKHTHTHTIPVEWEYLAYDYFGSGNEWGKVSTLHPAKKRVTKLMCLCLDIKDITV